ncbi:uncharacterized protein A4U43_C09F10460 [Asparagus officinalis]|uniref:Uncharacterized protein n=1 Tax=Asparagus officinalis TaxID=4686 RepID=A0A5P1E6K6_ASPOF|nr:uncharacterized protein A4U43_C09F10460 [Asparagus officinalis]
MFLSEIRKPDPFTNSSSHSGSTSVSSLSLLDCVDRISISAPVTNTANIVCVGLNDFLKFNSHVNVMFNDIGKGMWLSKAIMHIEGGKNGLLVFDSLMLLKESNDNLSLETNENLLDEVYADAAS